MLLSHKKKFLFIHNPKAAGSSVSSALQQYRYSNLFGRAKAGLAIRMKRKFNLKLKLNSNDYPVHTATADLKKLIPANIFNSYYKFGFVRNPWDWQVSLYHYIRKDKNHEHHHLVNTFKTFDEYIRWRVAGHVFDQKSMFYDQEENLLVDFVGKFETLNEDFDSVCNKLKLNTSLPHLNSSREKSNSFLKFYTPETLKLVEDAFADDIRLFGYTTPKL